MAAAYAEIGRDFLAFSSYVYDGFAAPAHVRKIADALERVARGECKRLIISIPPRHYKSTLCAQLFPAYLLGLDPDKKIIVASYGADLAEDHSRNCREIISGERYSKVFPGTKLAKDSASVSKWSVEGARGGYKAVGVGGPLTGHGAHVLIIDDPHKSRKEADSEINRKTVYDWYSSDAYSRLQPSPAEGAVILIHTRFHAGDLIGLVEDLAKTDPNADQWEVIALPAIDADGKPLFWDLPTYETIRANTQPIDWAALWQGDPVVSTGDFFQESWLKFEPSAPEFERHVRYYDLAQSKNKKSDYSACAKVAQDADGTLWILDVWRAKQSFPENKATIISNAAKDGIDTVIGLPSDLIGNSLYQELEPRLLGVPFAPPFSERRAGTKQQRAMVWQSRAQAGKLRIVKGAWNDDLLREMLAFPSGTRDDMIDAISGAVALLASSPGGLKELEKPLPVDSWAYIQRLAELQADQSDDPYGW